MKYLKKYENIYGDQKDEVKSGDYVIMKSLSGTLKDKIGQVLRVRKHYNEIDVEYDNPKINKLFGLTLSDVEHCSSDREKLEMLINSEKYNL